MIDGLHMLSIERTLHCAHCEAVWGLHRGHRAESEYLLVPARVCRGPR